MAGTDRRTDPDEIDDEDLDGTVEIVEPDPFDNLGPDERDRDLMDGTWERRRAAAGARRDWSNVQLAVGILIVLGLLVPLILTVTQ